MQAETLGRYRIIEEIGRGAMGVVYKGVDPDLDRIVAVKTIGMSADPTERAEHEARFFQEAKAAGGLAHPNIIVVYEVGKSGTESYMAMEFLEGEELGRHFKPGVPAALRRAIDVAAQIAAGLAYAHEHGVVHRDIKPANIMVLRDGSVKITDFGIARMRTSEVKTQTGMLLGSPRYMSPEVFLGKRADARSDIFSLGVILYELVTGAAPFTGDSVNALMVQTLNFAPPPPSSVRRSAPKMLDFIIAKLLAKAPEQRYQDAGEVASDLRECLRLVADESPDTGGGYALADTVPLAAPAESHDRAPTLAISLAFDSLSATQRLASRTGMEAATSRIATTVSLKQPALAHHKPTASRSGWTGREMAIFGCGLVVAILIAGAIAAA